MLGNCNRADAGAATTVGNREGLVQVQVRHVAAELAGLRDADERVHVRAVDVDLPARFVHEIAHLAHVVVVDAVGRRVGDHDRGERVAVGIDLGAQVIHVDVA